MAGARRVNANAVGPVHRNSRRLGPDDAPRFESMRQLIFVSETTSGGTTRPPFVSFFTEPAFWYNFLNFCFATVGVVLGVWALYLAYVQLRKTLRAAEAAQLASKATMIAMLRLTELTKVDRLSDLSGQVLILLRGEIFVASNSGFRTC